MTNSCSINLLESALDGSLRGDDEVALQHHLDECESCSAVLENMAGWTEWCKEASSLLTEDELDEMQPSREDWAVDFTVEHLEPSEKPDAIGRLGEFDVLEVIGQGGMGVVLKAHDRKLNRYVAIKVLSPHLAQNSLARKRFAREAQAAAAVVHPHVLAIHQVQPNGALPYLVMPLVSGDSVAERVARRGTLELTETLRIGMQAAAGLSAAHEQGLVHRDVKPANILLEKGVERAVLTDFGLARAADDVTLTRYGIIAGTPQYMSPEQARGEALDGRSDLFSLGCVLYEMSTGVSPFRADSLVATMRRLVEEQPRAMESLNPELPPWFVAIVERLLEKDASRRYSTAKEVSELLEGCLAHVQQPANVPLPKGLPRTKSAGSTSGQDSGRRRNRWGAVAAGVLLLGVGGAAFMFATAEPSDISGEWTGEGWNQVTLKQVGPAEYTGTYTDTFGKEPGKIDLKWSRIERRYNGKWSEGKDRFGKISVRQVGEEIRGAWTTNRKAEINPGTPELADLLWVRPTDAKGVNWFSDFKYDWKTDNAKRTLPPLVGRDRLRVLLAEDATRWEYRYLNALFRGDAQIEFDELLFFPTAHGTGKLADRPEFPSNVEGFARYDVVILGDIGPQQLPAASQRALDEYVRERGGNLVVIAGPNSMPAAFAGQPLQHLLPVEQTRNATPAKGYSLHLTDEGRGNSALAIEDSAEASQNAWREIYNKFPVMGLSDFCRPRPGAHVLIEAKRQAAGPAAADFTDHKIDCAFLSWQRAGRGHVAYLAAGDTYRLRWRRGDQYYDRFWIQFLSWLTDRRPGAAIDRAKDTLAFGPVIERTLTSIEVGGDSMMQLDSGELITTPTVVNDFDKATQWMSEHEADLVACWDGGGRGLRIVDGIAIGLGKWESSPKEVINSIEDMERQLAEYARTIPGFIDPSEGGFNNLWATGDEQPVFFIRTRKGTLGTLQIMKMTKDPHTVTFRYKLLKSAGSDQVQPKRQRFDPVKGKAGDTHWGIFRPPSLFSKTDWVVMASMTIGGEARIELPDDKQPRCVIKLVKGNDEAITVQVLDAAKKSITTVSIARDQSAQVTVDGAGYDISYKSVGVSPTDPDTSPFAQVMVRRIENHAQISEKSSGKSPASDQPIAEAVRAFNEAAKKDPVGKDQPALTEDELVSSVRWLFDSEKDHLSADQRELTKKVGDERVLPAGWRIDVLTTVDGEDGEKFQAWMIQLQKEGDAGKKAVHIVRQQLLCQLDAAGKPMALPALKKSPADDDATPLAAAIHEFNQTNTTLCDIPQKPLTEEEVVAAIRWWKTRRNESPATNGAFAAFQKMADTRQLPKSAVFELTPSFRNFDGSDYFIWSVRIRTPQESKPNWTFAYTLRQQHVRSEGIEEKNSGISWGSSHEDGLQAGVRLMPRNLTYKSGKVVTPVFYYRNNGNRLLYTSFPNLMTHGYYSKIAVVDAAGKEIPIEQDQRPSGPVGWQEIHLEPGRMHEVSGMPILLGDGERGSAETAIRAKPGQSVHVRFVLPRPDKEKGKPIETGDAVFSIKEPETRTSEFVRRRPAKDEAKLEFGAVVERTIQDFATGKNSCLSLESGELLSPPQDLISLMQVSDWARKNHVDLVADEDAAVEVSERGERRGLALLDVFYAAPASWDATANDAVRTIPYIEGQLARGNEDKDWLRRSKVRASENSPTTLYIRNRDGKIGILQITGFNENPRGVKIRYKLVKPADVSK